MRLFNKPGSGVLMKIYVGVTDNNWYNFLAQQEPDEVNFWQPGGKQNFRALEPYGVFLFKLHAPYNFIAGGGFFVRYQLPVSLAWEAFGTKNGAAVTWVPALFIVTAGLNSCYQSCIGCIVLTQPSSGPQSDWILLTGANMLCRVRLMIPAK